MLTSKIFHTIEELGPGYFGDVFLVKRIPPSRNWEKAAMKVIQHPGKKLIKKLIS